MTPYEAHLPCLNPSCKSHGKPHPNCRCYGAMAEGGEASHFCSENQAHNPDCQYYVYGGDVIPDDEVQLDAPAQSDNIPDDEVKVDGEIPDNEVKLDEEIPDDEVTLGEPLSWGQQALGNVEAAGRGVGGALFTIPEIASGLTTAEDIERRKSSAPIQHATIEGGAMALSMMADWGLPGIIGHLIPEASAGAKMLGGLIANAPIAASDEVQKYLLGHDNSNPEHSVATALVHGVETDLGMSLAGPLFKTLGKGVEAITPKMADVAEKFLKTVAEKGTPIGTPQSVLNQPLNTLGIGITAQLGLEAGGAYQAVRHFAQPWIEKMIGKPVSKANQYVTDAILGALSKENLVSIPTARRWGEMLSSGVRKYEPVIDSILRSGAQQIVPPALESAKEELKKNVEEGSLQTEMQSTSQNNEPSAAGYAQGGSVSPVQPQQQDHFGSIYPEANVLMNQAKGRIYQYLNSIRPLPNTQKLPFDSDVPNKAKQKSYDTALGLAVNPLQILNHVNKGDLTPEHMQHFTALYPEVHKLLSQKMTDQITKAQLKGEKPSYAKRQSLSMFLGANLDTSLTPQAIQAAQGTFAQKQAMQQQMQPPDKKKKGTAPLSKSSQSFLTGDQAREQRQQNQKA